MLTAHASSQDLSRPPTQNSIHSSNSGVMDELYTTKKRFATTHEINPLTEIQESYNGIEIMVETTSPLLYDIKSPKDSSNTGINSLDSDLDLLNDIPGSCVSLAYSKISSEFLKTGETASASLTDYTTSSKLSCQVLDFSDLSPLSKKAYTRKNLIEEIIETEDSYISSLRMLSGIYLDPLINNGNNGIPVRLLRQYVDLLTTFHSDFCFELRNLCSISYRATATIGHFITEEFNEKAKTLASITSPLMAALVAELISKKAISVLIYQEYHCVHDLVLKLIESAEETGYGLTLTRGFQKFLEASQNDKADLSLASLIHRPVQRIPKYKLFLETLSKLTSADEDLECHHKIINCLVHVDYSLKEINRYGLQERSRAETLFRNLIFTSATLKYPVEYLGLPLLISSLSCIWVGRDGLVQHQNLGAFLFKTHLIFANIQKSNKYEVTFLIPLSVTCLIDNNDDSNNLNGGLLTSYPDSLKLSFEHHYALFEIMIVSSKQTIDIWRERLDIMVNFVNGPYKLDYSASRFNEEQNTQASTIIPPDIQAYDANVEKAKAIHSTGTWRSINRDNVLNRCYFGKVISLQIKFLELDCRSVRFKASGSESIIIRHAELRKLEFLLEDITSDEFISHKEKATQNRNKSTNIVSCEKVNWLRDKSLRRSSVRSKGTKVSFLMRKTSMIFRETLKSVFQSE